MTAWATYDFLAFTAIGGCLNLLRLSAEQGDTTGLDHCIERKRRSGLTLTPAAMAAVNNNWRLSQTVTNFSAGATTFEY
jgi:hypothetical protein